MMKIQLIRFFLIFILSVSLVALIIVYFSDYVHEVHIARALPLSIVAGLTAVAISISEKDTRD